MLLLTGFLLLTWNVQGQCPDRDSLLNRLHIFEAGKAKGPTDLQLAELLQYEARLKGCVTGGDSIYTLLLQRIGVLYYNQYKYLNAIKYVTLANNLIAGNLRKTGVDPTQKARNYYILSLSYDSLKMPFDKLACEDSCIFILDRLPNEKNINSMLKFTLNRLWRRVLSLSDVGEYKRAGDFVQMGERILRKSRGFADSLKYQGNFLSNKVNTFIAVKNYAAAEAMLRNMATFCNDDSSSNLLGTIYDMLAQVQVFLNRPQQAKAYFQLSLINDRKSKDTIGCMQTYTDMGYYLYDKYHHDNVVALACYVKGLAWYRSSRTLQETNRMDALNLMANIANVYVQDRQYDSAFHYFQLAFSQIKPGLQESDLLQIPLLEITTIEYLTSLLLDEGDAYLKRYTESNKKADFSKAISIYTVADRLLDKIRTEQSDVQSKLFWRRDNHRLYEHAIEACYASGDKTDEAFYFFEKSRASLLNDQLTEQQFLGDDDMFRQAQLLTKNFNLRMELSMSVIDSEHYNKTQNELLQNNEEFDRLQRRNINRDALLGNHMFDSSSITIGNVRKTILKDHQALVELFEGDSAVYIMAITKSGAQLRRIDKADYNNTLQQYLDYISDPSRLNRDLQGYYAVAGHLYQLLFAGQALPLGRIIVSPDGRYFPLETLITAKGKTPAYFVYQYAVSYTYSARYLLILNKEKHHVAAGTRTMLGMAPVTYPYDATLPGLRDSDGSVRRVQAYFTDADTMLYAKASKHNFLRDFHKYKIIYLSTHASDSGSMGEPVIFFADEPMSLSELVAEKRPETELVIASACKTGLGRVNRGEGVFNFSRGFAAVGIPACVNNLWSVEESAANRLTELFCKYIAADVPTDVALQKAKIEFMQTATDNQQLPYYWAASILSGKTGVIKSKQPFAWMKALLLPGLVICVVGVVALIRLRATRSIRAAKA